MEIIRCKREKKLLIAYQLSKQGRVIPTPEILLPLWAEMWPLDAERLQSKLGELYSICSWIKDCLEKYDYNTDYFQKEIEQQRTRQKRRLNRKYALHKAHVILLGKQNERRLARYLLIWGDLRKVGDYSKLMEYERELQAGGMLTAQVE